MNNRAVVKSLIALFIGLLSVMLYMSHWQLQEQGGGVGDLLGAPVHNLFDELSTNNFYSSGPEVINSSDGTSITGKGRIEFSLNAINKLHGLDSRYALVADVELKQTGYRSYATLVLREDTDRLYSSRVWAVSDNAAWQRNTPTKLVLPFPTDLKLADATANLILYQRAGELPIELKLKSLVINEFESTEDPGAQKIMLVAQSVLALSSLCILIFFIILTRDYAGLSNPRWINAAILFFGSCLLASVGLLETLAIDSLRLRADAWSYDIIARSISQGLGFRSYNILEVGTYPLVPIYYSLFYKLFGASVVTVVWSNIALLVFAWVLIVFLDGQFSAIRAMVSLVLLAFWIVPWASMSWTLSENLGAFALLSFVWCIGFAFRTRDGAHLSIALFFVGVVSAAAALTRTEFYALAPLAVIFVLLFLRRKRVLVRCTLFLLGFFLVIAPWLVFQKVASNAEIADGNVISSDAWSSDLTRVTEAMALSKDSIFKKVPEGGLANYGRAAVHNLKTIVSRPYSFYVYDVPAKRNEHLATLMHLIILLLFTVASLGGVFARNCFTKTISGLILLIIFYRLGYLSLLTDSPRYFSCFVFIVVIQISEAIRSVFRDAVNGRRECETRE